MLQTTQADQNQSLQQELAIFHALLTETKIKKAYTHSNPDKKSLAVDSETGNSSIFGHERQEPSC
jgi:hypothetical protein